MSKLLIAASTAVLFSQASLAQEVSVTLPASRIPANEFNPPCGNTALEGQVASSIINGLSGALDSYIGMPVTAATVQSLGGSGEVLARLGLHNGKSACQTVCILASPNQRFRTWMSDIPGRGGNGWTNHATVNTPEITNGEWEFGKSVNSSVARRGNAVLFCTIAKNWSHDQSREFRLSAE